MPGHTLTYRILEQHLRRGRLQPGEEIGIAVDQVITQDATGTVAYLQFEAAMSGTPNPRFQVPLAVQYIDHNTLETTPRNRDDHLYLETAARRYGAWFSPAGAGIIHQVHLERFARPGATLVGSDSHCCNAGAMGMFALGAGGLDTTQALATGVYFLRTPRVVRVVLEGDLDRPWVTAMDVMLELLRRLGVKGGVGRAYEFAGPGVARLSLTERATIANMGIENGSTATVFPSDARTRRYLEAQQRGHDWEPLAADADAVYDDELRVDLSALGPLIARPSSPADVVPLRQAAGIEVQQVCVGSCTNSSMPVMMQIAALFRGDGGDGHRVGRRVAPGVEMLLTPGSRQVLSMLSESGDLQTLLHAGVRVLEPVCGPCVGMGGSPGEGAVTVRSFNRNFPGRSGTASARMYLCNPLACAAIATVGAIVDPRELDLRIPVIAEPDEYLVEPAWLEPPAGPDVAPQTLVRRAPTIKDVPVKAPLASEEQGRVLLKLGDNVSTDEIMPAGAEVLPLRSDIPAIAEHVFERVDPDFPRRARAAGAGFIVAGENYGQGSSREHAALAPMYLGVRGVIARSLARIHQSNLINYGLLPLQFVDANDYDRLETGDLLLIPSLRETVEAGAERLRVVNQTRGTELEVRLTLTDRERQVLLAGGLLAVLKQGTPAGGAGEPAEPCH
jgi:aconitate hydratase